MTTFAPSLASTNYSISTLPMYYVFSILPHAYAVNVATGGKNTEWENSNPRSPETKAKLRASLSESTYARYERCEAAHNNSLESFVYFAAAILAGNLARLPAEELNNFALGFFAIRIGYVAAYIGIESNKASYTRSALWMAGLGWSLRMLWRAGSVLA